MIQLDAGIAKRSKALDSRSALDSQNFRVLRNPIP